MNFLSHMQTKMKALELDKRQVHEMSFSENACLTERQAQ